MPLPPTACQATRRSVSFFEKRPALDARTYANTTMLPVPMLATVSGGIKDIEFPSVSSGTAIGISVAIAGNVLISLALNLQKLAHARLEKARTERFSGLEDIEEEDSADEGGEHNLDPPSEVEMEARVWKGSPNPRPQGSGMETDPLIPFPRTGNGELPHLSPTYGTVNGADDGHLLVPDGSPLQWKRNTKKGPGAGDAAKYVDRESQRESMSEGQESEYLRSKLW